MKEINKKKGSGRVIWVIVLQMAVLLYSTTTLFSKEAAKHQFPEMGYLLCYAGLIMVLGLYAIIWQQIIKHLPLTVAHANKAVSVIWGVVFAVALYGEKVSIRQIIGCAVIIAGTILYVAADAKENTEQHNETKGEHAG